MDTPYEYTSTHLRRQLIMFLAKNADYFIKQQHFMNSIKGLYGWPEPSKDDIGPFSFHSYLQYMLEDDSWADEVVIHSLSLMFQVTITILRGLDLTEVTVRHGLHIKDVDLLYLYTGGNHYSVIGMFKISFVRVPGHQEGVEVIDAESLVIE